MKVLTIVQARISSARLPGKVLLELQGTPVLGHLLKRLSGVFPRSSIVVATSTEADDDVIEQYCRQLEFRVFRGSLHDVRSRFDQILQKYSPDAFARVNGDSPLYDPALITLGIEKLSQGYDLVTNAVNRTYPPGQGTEVCTVDAFRRSQQASITRSDEHVTSEFYMHPDRYRILNFSADADYRSCRLAIDTEEDFQRLTTLMRAMKKDPMEYGWRELVSLYRELKL